MLADFDREIAAKRRELRAADEERTPPVTLAPYWEIDAQTLWDRVRYLYERIVPAAEVNANAETLVLAQTTAISGVPV